MISQFSLFKGQILSFRVELRQNQRLTDVFKVVNRVGSMLRDAFQTQFRVVKGAIKDKRLVLVLNAIR